MANIINIAGAGREFSYNQSYQKSQSDVLNNPNQYGLYTADQYQAKLSEYNRGVTDGRNDVINHPNNYALYTKSQYNNHDIPRRIGFQWKRTWYYPSSFSDLTHDDTHPIYPANDKTNYEWILEIYVNEHLVKEGEGLYDVYGSKDLSEGTYNYKYGKIDETINV
jgi:hypothetical protein